MRILTIFLSLSLFSLSFSWEISSSPLLQRPQILELNRNAENRFIESLEELQLHCTSWRFAVESNNVGPWKTIPPECASYVRDYMMGRAYRMDLERVSNEARVYAKGIRLDEDGKDAWIFDVDETLLSNLPYYADHGYGLEVFNSVEFDKWVEKAMAPPLEPSLRLYEVVLQLGFKVFLLTGRSEKQREVTVKNLMNAGVQVWERLILRATEDHGKLTVVYKSEKRNEMAEDGYRIIGNSGDQWSDLLGPPMSHRSFKLPNPMYFIP